MKKAKKDARQLKAYNRAKTFQMQERARIRCKPFNNDVYNGKEARIMTSIIDLTLFRRLINGNKSVMGNV